MFSLDRFGPGHVVDPHDHDDVFDAQNLLQVDAAELKTTCVSPHMEAPIKKEPCASGAARSSWRGTSSATGGRGSPLCREGTRDGCDSRREVFPQRRPRRGELCRAADFVRNDVHGRIGRELLRKFGGRATPKFLPSPADTPRPQDIVAYSYLFKNLEFGVVFERIEQPLTFGESRVSCFGIGEVFKPGQRAMYAQVLVLDTRTPTTLSSNSAPSRRATGWLWHTTAGKTLRRNSRSRP